MNNFEISSWQENRQEFNHIKGASIIYYYENDNYGNLRQQVKLDSIKNDVVKKEYSCEILFKGADQLSPNIAKQLSEFLAHLHNLDEAQQADVLKLGE
jgi:hypothetical protein